MKKTMKDNGPHTRIKIRCLLYLKKNTLISNDIPYGVMPGLIFSTYQRRAY